MDRTTDHTTEPGRTARWDRAYQELLAWASAGSAGGEPGAVDPDLPPQEETMRVALYARVSTQRQAQAQTVEQQLDRLKNHANQQSWLVSSELTFRDDGYSGASLKRPGLDRLRDRAAARDLDVVLITAPDRLARKLCASSSLARRTGATWLPGTILRSANEPGSA